MEWRRAVKRKPRKAPTPTTPVYLRPRGAPTLAQRLRPLCFAVARETHEAWEVVLPNVDDVVTLPKFAWEAVTA